MGTGALSVDRGSGILVFRLSEPELLAEAQAVVSRFRDTPVADLQAMDDPAYHRLVREHQDRINGAEWQARFVRSNLHAISAVLGTTDVLVQATCYLRAVRPGAGRAHESIGWHRESFYGPDMERAFNLWIPLMPISAENALCYIPGSHLIPDAEIICESLDEGSASVARHSDGHKIGLLYAPKRIVGGVDLSSLRRLHVEEGTFAIFPASLIHGAGTNLSAGVRLSIDMRIIHGADTTGAHVQGSTRERYFRGLGPGMPTT